MSEVPDRASHVVSTEEIAKLWMSENAVVNQKTSYFIATNAFIVAAMGVVLTTGGRERTVPIFIAACGLFFSLLTLSSVGRTCTYRDHLIGLLKGRSDDYKKVLTPEAFPWYARLESSFVLQALPVVSLLLWLVVLVYVFARPPGA